MNTTDPTGTLVVDHIGLLVTNDPTLGEGPLGLVRDAALVVQDGHVVAIDRAGSTSAAADRCVDAGGRCVLPGFVDSHTHLVFAGERGDEFVARMAGAPYAAGGIRTTVQATRAASDEQLARPHQGPPRRGRSRRHHHARDQVRVRPRRRPTRRVVCTSPRRSASTPRSSVRTWYPPSSRDGSTTTCTTCAPTCSTQPPRTPAGSTRSARWARSTPTSAVPCSRPAQLAGSVVGCTPTSSATVRACSSGSRWAARRSTTAPTCPPPTSTRWRPAPRSPPSCPPPTSPPASRTPTPGACSMPASPSHWPPTATRAAATRPRCRSASPSRSATCG
jgi:hypothetical protein